MEAKQHEGRSLRYRVVEPDGYRRDREYPLVVLMHGYGSHMGDLIGLLPMMDTRSYLYVFPNAPIRMEVGYGMHGFAWSEPPEGQFDADGSAEEQLGVFIDEVMERYDLRPGNAVLGGFSQGGMLAYSFGLPRPDEFRGVVALSSRIPGRGDLDTRLPARRDQSIFISHGTLDTVIPVEAARSSSAFLEANGYKPEYNEYEMAHQITEDVLQDLAAWLRRVLPPAGH